MVLSSTDEENKASASSIQERAQQDAPCVKPDAPETVNLFTTTNNDDNDSDNESLPPLINLKHDNEDDNNDSDDESLPPLMRDPRNDDDNLVSFTPRANI